MENNKVTVNPTEQYTYFINLDERGEFYADIRKSSGETVYEIRGFDIFEDGYMKNKTDIVGLQRYLVQLGILTETNPLDMSS